MVNGSKSSRMVTEVQLACTGVWNEVTAYRRGRPHRSVPHLSGIFWFWRGESHDMPNVPNEFLNSDDSRAMPTRGDTRLCVPTAALNPLILD